VQYSFENRCVEEPDLSLDDGAKRIFLNSAGTFGGSDELKRLVNYIVDSKAYNAVDEATRKLHKIVEQIRIKPEWGVEYMKAVEHDFYIRQEGIEQGIELGNEQKLFQLVKKKLEKGQSPEVIADALEEDIDTIKRIICNL